MNKQKIIIIGAGPAGLFCAYHLLQIPDSVTKLEVHLFDQMPSVGRKFLIAGKSGLNLTHSAPLDDFATKYGKDEELFKGLLTTYSAEDVRQWAHEIGIETFVGSSGRVFPKEMKAAKMLASWQKKLKEFSNFHLHLNHRFTNFKQEKSLCYNCYFEHEGEELAFQADKLVLSMGGGSWKNTGSDGKWMQLMNTLQVETTPLVGANCGYEANWSDAFIQKIDRSPLKNIELKIANRSSRGEMMLTPFGVEGTAVYNLSDTINEHLQKTGQAILNIDLKPDLTFQQILEKISNKKSKQSLSNHLRKTLKLNNTVSMLLRELIDKESFNDQAKLAKCIKSLSLKLVKARPIDEAISTSGGVSMSEMNSKLELHKYPGVYIIGEMLDFHAPTGGYLLQACFSTAYFVAKNIIEVLPNTRHN